MMMTMTRSWRLLVTVAILFGQYTVTLGQDSQSPTAAPVVFSIPSTSAPNPAPVFFFTPTLPPTKAPTASPTSAPTPAPTKAPTAAPTKAPTPAPTKAPTKAPTASPTPAPTAAPTPAPVVPPTNPPTPAPVVPPTNAPTPAPVIPPTEAPIPAPVVLPTEAPIATPVVIPTNAPTPAPVVPPTDPPTLAPTASTPSTPAPTGVVPATPLPTPATPSPTAITPSPTIGLVEVELFGLTMNLIGITDFPEEDHADWEQLTAAYQELYYSSVFDSPIEDFDAEVTLTAIIVTDAKGGRLRHVRSLQDVNLVVDLVVGVIYNQSMTYRYIPGAPEESPLAIASAPFVLSVGREFYVETLQNSGKGVLVAITGSSEVSSDATFQPTAAPVTPDPPTEAPTEEEDDEFLSRNAIIGIAAGGGVGALLICWLLFCRDSDDYEATNEPPPSVNVKRGGDEVSTLAAPNAANRTTNDSINFGDQSVATVDYDYSKAYGGGGDTSVSSAGGTFGSQTQGQSILDPATASATGAALGGVGSFSDADSFEAAYRDPNGNVREELINIFAPPGKLGVVIDTPDDGAPVVHAVKDSSVIANKIQVGDKLVAVDDEDVRSMTAIKVSKLISRKSANPSRKLSIIRTTVIE